MSTIIASFTETLGLNKPGYISIADNGDSTVTVTVRSGGLLGLGATGIIHMTKTELLEFLGLVGIKVAPLPTSVSISAGD